MNADSLTEEFNQLEARTDFCCEEALNKRDLVVGSKRVDRLGDFARHRPAIRDITRERNARPPVAEDSRHRGCLPPVRLTDTAERWPEGPHPSHSVNASDLHRTS